jgi:putative ubiquitin-RnfH superfamily antitoxin RatB of RatAB toxin-antitoxin module|tara:strand:+ start:1265 stop:1666 length:402 start_codon:yes stop_codon:yes gene_type:complete
MNDNSLVDKKEHDEIRVEVAFALPERQELVAMSVVSGCTAQEAVDLSGIRMKFPEFDLDSLELGIFSRPLNGVDLPLAGAYVMEENDRVEIYRPLLNDPKHARLERVRIEQRNMRKERDKKNKERKNKRQEQK